jgi:CMP-N,N'-diacetyllegionaminic acid synthase
MTRIYGLIPARKGSKRLPQKNIRSLNGKLVIEYTIEEALKSRYIDEIFITTDDPVVIRTANKYNLKYLQRKSKLCLDTTSMQEVVDDFLLWIPGDRQPDLLVLLQPTSPLRVVDNIDKCIKLYLDGNFGSVVTVSEIAPHTYYPNGAVYVFKENVWEKPVGLICMEKNESIDIDNIFDLKMVKMILDDDNSRSRNKS